MKTLLSVVAALAIAAITEAAPARHVRVIDGDTVEASGLQVWPSVSIDSHIRLHRVDAPEMSKGSPCEDAAGAAAKRHLESLLAGQTDVEVQPIVVDNFGRVVAEVTVNGVNLSDRMVTDGHAVFWTGKRIPWACVDAR